MRLQKDLYSHFSTMTIRTRVVDDFVLKKTNLDDFILPPANNKTARLSSESIFSDSLLNNSSLANKKHQPLSRMRNSKGKRRRLNKCANIFHEQNLSWCEFIYVGNKHVFVSWSICKYHLKENYSWITKAPMNSFKFQQAPNSFEANLNCLVSAHFDKISQNICPSPPFITSAYFLSLFISLPFRGLSKEFPEFSLLGLAQAAKRKPAKTTVFAPLAIVIHQKWSSKSELI